jgi:hypothetical protein
MSYVTVVLIQQIGRNTLLYIQYYINLITYCCGASQTAECLCRMAPSKLIHSRTSGKAEGNDRISVAHGHFQRDINIGIMLGQ